MSIEERAEQYAVDNYESCMYDDTKGWENDYKARKEAYIAGYNDAQSVFRKNLINRVYGNHQ